MMMAAAFPLMMGMSSFARLGVLAMMVVMAVSMSLMLLLFPLPLLMLPHSLHRLSKKLLLHIIRL